MIGVGRMGANMVQRLLADGHQCVVYDQDNTAQAELVGAGAVSTESLESLVAALVSPRVIWMMLPASAVDYVVGQLDEILAAGDTVIDGGNSNFQDDRRRAEMLATGQINYVDVGTTGGVWGLVPLGAWSTVSSWSLELGVSGPGPIPNGSALGSSSDDGSSFGSVGTPGSALAVFDVELASSSPVGDTSAPPPDEPAEASANTPDDCESPDAALGIGRLRDQTARMPARIKPTTT
ncbi:MAG: hypothetical protein IIC12_05635, partial [Proteobacteria bacterium]|nr:hypothetical protein [Pseudomonadota bacterium]